MPNITPPLITAPRARKLFAILNEQLFDQDDALNDAVDAHLTHNDKAFYRAMTTARESRAYVARVLNLIGLGEYEAAEKLLGLEFWDKKK